MQWLSHVMLQQTPNCPSSVMLLWQLRQKSLVLPPPPPLRSPERPLPKPAQLLLKSLQLTRSALQLKPRVMRHQSMLQQQLLLSPKLLQRLLLLHKRF